MSHRLPMVMPTNLVSKARILNCEYPGRLGVLISPSGWANPHGLPYALDNDRFSVWSKGKEWREGDFLDHLDRTVKLKYPPLWVVVPDVVANAEETFKWWDTGWDDSSTGT
jgi:hypothetical protein